MRLDIRLFCPNFGQYRDFYGTDREFIDRTYFISSRASTYTHRDYTPTQAGRGTHTATPHLCMFASTSRKHNSLICVANVIAAIINYHYCVI